MHTEEKSNLYKAAQRNDKWPWQYAKSPFVWWQF